jgi:hypothetical protein
MTKIQKQSFIEELSVPGAMENITIFGQKEGNGYLCCTADLLCGNTAVFITESILTEETFNRIYSVCRFSGYEMVFISGLPDNAVFLPSTDIPERPYLDFTVSPYVLRNAVGNLFSYALPQNLSGIASFYLYVDGIFENTDPWAARVLSSIPDVGERLLMVDAFRNLDAGIAFIRDTISRKRTDPWHMAGHIEPVGGREVYLTVDGLKHQEAFLWDAYTKTFTGLMTGETIRADSGAVILWSLAPMNPYD